VQISRAILKTPLGDMLALDSGDGLCALEFTGPKKRLPRRWRPGCGATS
jgi:hypothetical protein